MDGSVVQPHRNLLQHLTSLFGIKQRKFLLKLGAFGIAPLTRRDHCLDVLYRFAALRDQLCRCRCISLGGSGCLPLVCRLGSRCRQFLFDRSVQLSQIECRLRRSLRLRNQELCGLRGAWVADSFVSAEPGPCKAQAPIPITADNAQTDHDLTMVLSL